MASVKLIAYTQGVGDLQCKSVGEILGYVARVSNPDNQLNFETTPKLLSYCMKKGHWSVFETCYVTMEITTSVAIATQILRHRSFTAQQFSQRYSEVNGTETYMARSQDPNNKQNSVDDLPEATKDWFMEAQQLVGDTSMAVYKQALSKGIAREQARFLLPVSATTTMYMTGNIRSWITYGWTRAKKDSGSQLEHMEIANKCRDIIVELVPELKEYI